MEENLKELKKEYNNKKSENNSLKLKKDYKEMKSLLKYTNKLLKDAEKDQKKWDKVWDKFHKEYEELEKTLIDDESFNDKLKKQQNLEQSKQIIKEFDNLIAAIDKKIEKLENQENDVFNRLKRFDLANKYGGYHVKNNLKTNDDILEFLNVLQDYLNGFEYISDSNFVLSGRKAYIYDEVFEYLNGKIKVDNPVLFAIGTLDEFFSNNNFIYSSDSNYDENKSKNDKYVKSGFICKEEKECIDNIINAIKDTLI